MMQIQRNNERFWFGAVALLALLLSAASAFAQSDTAALSGFVKDPSGAVIPGATVKVRSEATGADRSTQTNADGYWIVSALQPGLYAVSAEAQGFKHLEVIHKKLDPGIPAQVDLSLQVGVVAESVIVTAAASSIQTDSATVGKLVEGKQVSDLQLNGRNPIFLAMLKPGVQRGGSLAALSYAVDNGGMSINGARVNDTLITFDGAVGIRSRGNNTSNGVADLDSVQEVQVLTANYAAEYGRTNGGQIRIVTKGGTRDLHGAAYEYFRNSALNANSWTRNQSVSTNFTTPERYNQFGWNLGGPIFIPRVLKTRDRAFFYFSEEFLRRRLASTATGVVPTDAMRTGDFSQLLAANPFYSGPRIIKDPSNGTPIPGNVIPSSLLSPNGQALLRVYPKATPGFQLGSSNWISAASTPANQRKETAALDFIPNQKNFVHVRAMVYNYNDSAPFGTNFDLYPVIKNRPEQTGSVNWTYMASPTLVVETLASVTHDKLTIGIGTDSGLFDRTRYGINYPYAFPGTKDIDNKIPTVGIPNFTSYSGTPYPSSFAGPIYNIGSNATKVAGAHSIKFGVVYEHTAENNRDQITLAGVPGGTDNQNGAFAFSDTRTGGSGLGLADAVLGLYNTYGEAGSRSYTLYRGQMFEWFAQDRWKATPRLTLEYGIRHSIIQPYSTAWGNQAMFDPAFYNPVNAVQVDKAGNPIAGKGDPLNGMVIPGSGWGEGAKGRVAAAGDPQYNRLFHNLSDYFVDMHWRDFQPRLGVAYAFNSKTVLRAGGGKFVERLGVNDSTQFGGNAPMQPLASFALGKVDTPSGAAGASYPLYVTTEDKILQNPMAYTWNATFQREVGFGTTVEIGYVGRRGLRLQREMNINQLPEGTLFQPQFAGLNPNQLRPYLGYGPIRETSDTGKSLYNGLQMEVNHRFSKGLSFGGTYTFAKSMDNGSNYQYLLPNTYNDKNNWGASDFDVRHIVVLNAIYELPFLKRNKGLAGKTLGGWEVTTVTQFQTGTPVTISTADDFAGVGTGSGNQIWSMAAAPEITHQFATSATSGQYWFTPTLNGAPIFTAPANGTFTAQSNRGAIHNPGFQNWNIGLFKKFAFTERHALTFRAEAFNFINHPNWSGVNTNPKSATFGMVTAKNSERNLQLSLRYSF
jgi:hypothetical protein